jgi:hypothetical protein
MVSDILDELCRLLRRDAGESSNLYPFGELVHHHKDMLVAARGGTEGSY